VATSVLSKVPLKRAAALLLFLVSSCQNKKEAPPAPTTTTPIDATAPTESSSARATTNLLVTTAAEVTVSSRVDNPRDFPEHLVDGKRETAWNGKTGDLAAWIEVKLDPRVHVSAIAMTSGFDKGDLFEKNLRIEKLRIERDGVLVKEASLDPDMRRIQKIPIDGPGGTYRITVLATKAGTNAKWKEIVVSDLEVLGEAPEDLRLAASRLPIVKVAPGSAPPPKRAENVWELTLAGRRGTSALAICEAWKRDVLALIRKWPGVYEHAECKAIPLPPIEGPRPREWKSLAAIERDYFDGVAVWTDHDLMVELDSGWVAGPCYRRRNDIGDSPSPLHSAMKIVPGSPTRLVMATVTAMAYWPKNLPDGGYEDVPGATVEHEARSCTISAGEIRCADGELPTRYKRAELSEEALKTLTRQRTITFPTLDASGKITPLADR
jgi:hypothetical protein